MRAVKPILSMAFFNLTYLGPQNPIKVTCESSGNTSTNAKKAEATAPSTNKLEQDRTVNKGELSRARHNGSYVKHTELMRKHTRNPLGPTDLHSVPATTTHMYGWWMKEDALKTEPWTYTERRPHVNSEMTR